MNRSPLLRTFFLGVLIVATWVLFVAVYLFGRQGILVKINQNSLVIITRTIVQEEAVGDQQHEVRLLKGLNQHTWEKPCQINLEQLCNYPIFPKAPDSRTFAEKIDVFFSGVTVAGIRLMGFLRPNVSGEYYFWVASNGFSEVWLSTDKNWRNAQKAAYTNPQNSSSVVKKAAFDAIKSQISDGVVLYANYDYYFEAVYVQWIQESREHLIQVAWKRPETKKFEIIDGDFLSPYKNDSHMAQLQVYDDDLPEVLSCGELRKKSSVTNNYMKPETLPYLEHEAVRQTLSFCEYRPSYLLKPANLRNFKKYHGVHRHTRKISSYPFPDVTGVRRGRKISTTFIGEYPLDAKEAMSVVSKYFEALKRAYPGKYELLSTRRVEKKEDPHKGSRYFLELVVKDLTDGASYILAEYVFRPKEKNASLCYPTGLHWNRTANVYLILTAKSLGRWVHHFIKNVEKIIQETKDERLHVVIYDFDSPDTDLKKQALEESSLEKYHFITKPGNYSRTVSFSAAIQSIKDPNAIVVTVDLHLDIGSRLIDDIRKHCIKGKMVYAPQIVYLNCDGSSALPKGSWYHYSYGTIATYKQDWDNFGGFSKDFFNKTTWGGEDWDLIDGAVKGGLEIERKRSPWIYHYYHSKKGMWQKKNATAAAVAKRNSKTGLAMRKPSPSVKVPPRKEISTKTKGVVQNKAPPHKDRRLQNKALSQKETNRQKEVSSGNQARLQAGQAIKKPSPSVKAPPRKEISTKTKGVVQNKAPPHKDRSLQNKALSQKETNRQKEVSSGNQARLQTGQAIKKPSPSAKAPPRKEISTKTKGVVQNKAPPHKELSLQNKALSQKETNHQKEISSGKQAHLQTVADSPKEASPQKRPQKKAPIQNKALSQKETNHQKKISSEKRAHLQKEVHSPKEALPKKAPIQNKALNNKDAHQQEEVSLRRQALPQKENHSQKEASPKNKDLPKIKAPLHKNVPSGSNAHNQKQPHYRKDDSRVQEGLAKRDIISLKEVISQNKELPLKEAHLEQEDHRPPKADNYLLKQAHPQKQGVSQKEAQLRHKEVARKKTPPKGWPE